MALFPRRASRPTLPAAVHEALTLGRGERILAFATDDNTGDHVVATTWSLAVVTGAGPVRGRLTARRPWHEVDTGVWQDEIFTLTVTWVDRARPDQWTFRGQESPLPEVLHERVQASVVASSDLDLGVGRRGRAAIRQDLATGSMLSQTVLGRGVPSDNPEVQAQVAAALADLRDQVGLPG